MRIIILEDTVFKITEADFKKLIKMKDDFSKKDYYPAKEMEINDFIEKLRPNFKYVGVVQFDFRL